MITVLERKCDKSAVQQALLSLDAYQSTSCVGSSQISLGSEMSYLKKKEIV